MRRVPVLLALSMLLAFGVGAAQDVCRLELRFLDASTLTPIQGVRVRLENTELSFRRDLPSGPDGRVLVFNLENGEWKAESEPEGYEWFSLTGLRCVPGGLVRMDIKLKPTMADVGLSLGDAPEIDSASNSAELFFKLPDAGIPREGVRSSDPAASGVTPELQPRSFEVHDLLSPKEGGLVSLQTWPRRAAGRGRLEVGLGVEAAGKLVRSRGVSRRQVLETPVLFDWVVPLAHANRLSVFSSAGLGSFESRSALSENWRGPISRKRSEMNSGRVAFDLESSAARRIAFDAYGGFVTENSQGMPATMYAVGAIPSFDSRLRRADAGIEFQWMASAELALNGELEWSRRTWKLEPSETGPLFQDFSPAGSLSSGFGQGLFVGDGTGFPEIHDREETLDASLGLMYSPSSGDLLTIGLDFQRNSRSFVPKNFEQPLDFARWRFWSDSRRSFDLLLPADGGRGVATRLGLSLSEIKRISPSVTLRVGLEMEERDFDSGPGRAGVHFGFGQTLSPEVALIWDFAGGGKSRSWISWSRTKPRLEEMVRLRLAGSLVSVGGEGASLPSQMGSLEVDPDLDPPSVDLFSLGLEREIVAHLRVGAAVSVERYRHGIAVLQLADSLSSLLAAPTPGSVWGDALERDTTRVSAWLRKTPSSRWQALLHIGWIGQSGTWEGNPFLDLTNPDLEFSSDVLRPGSLIGARGPLDGDRRFFIDCMASWYSVSGLSIGSHFLWRMGPPLSLRGAMDPGYGLDRRFVESRGSGGRGPSIGELDFNLEVPLGKGAPNLRVEVFNCLFFQKPEKIDQRWSLLDPVRAQGLTPEEQYTPGSFGKALRYQNPPEIRVSVQWHW